jgi:hypothetical protein
MITKGIARLLPELMKKAKGATSPATQVRNTQSAKLMAQGSNRIKKHYSDAFNEARARINNMDMSPAQKDAAVEKLRTFMRNQHSEEMMRTANLGDFAVTPLPDLVKKGLLFATGGALGYGVGTNKNAIVDMLKSTKLPTQVDVDFGMTPAGEIFGGKQDLLEIEDYMLPYSEIFGDPFNLVEEDEPEFDLALDEEPLEQGGIGDLLLWNRIFGN